MVDLPGAESEKYFPGHLNKSFTIPALTEGEGLGIIHDNLSYCDKLS